MSSAQRPDHAEWLQGARGHLRAADPVLAGLIDKVPDFDPRAWLAQLPPLDLFGALLFQVAGQQLSVAATRRTLARVEALFGGSLPTAEQLLRADPADLRQAGLSWRKVATLRDLAERLADGRLNAEAIERRGDNCPPDGGVRDRAVDRSGRADHRAGPR
jgi:DNA-3-methyladenine glycosylase II